ncbi:MAG: TlpA family protein disulfide reductase [Ignavibacteriales bacterium]|jgi:Peroxiredoxin|nr:MAG: TlpA family protein disulfide reductase [Ignavibacteriaceae bacterium]MBW7872770.1 TlpA family protein disulfide reductase [Ignavibacteria bacterium]MCZ2143490.1 TlpA family protein disulfide reductase [Ignavibacteriales bacterium]OQY72517.1 MAG: hypothetical protein B6D45_09090 [Ignavibacteriales bacterium UTCHB3]MBV6444367.1 Thiol-disulfide oxidoreductase ResA [Ignavibacteriaceae bacterium]
MFRYISLPVLLLSLSVFAQEGKTAPDFAIENLDGDMVSLSDNLGGGPILISFWATWCKPCIEELPEIQKIYDDLKSKGLKAFAISVDSEKTLARVAPFVKTNKITIPVLLDPNGDVARSFYAQDVPHTVVVNSSGEIVHFHSGYKKGDEIQLRELIAPLLEKTE